MKAMWPPIGWIPTSGFGLTNSPIIPVSVLLSLSHFWLGEMLLDEQGWTMIRTPVR